MRSDAIFRLASVTKPIVAATALALVDRGQVGLDDPVTRWLPDFKPKLRDGSTPEILLRHLLSHTAGLAYGSQLPDDPYNRAGVSGALDVPGLDWEENQRRLVSVPLYFAPGTAWRYSIAIDVLGMAVAKATGGTLADAVAECITRPLGMKDTAFNVVDASRLAVPYGDGKNGPVRMGEPHVVGDDPATSTKFSPARILDARSFQSGGAGMAGTAQDLMKFFEALRQGGAPILKRETLALASRNQIGNLPREEKDAGWRFGFLSAVMDDPKAAKSPISVGALEWGGAWGHRWLVDPTAGITIVILTNTAMEGVTGVFPYDVYAAVYG
jgi:CubicO group peptidase (beta-lactamase class C family)